MSRFTSPLRSRGRSVRPGVFGPYNSVIRYLRGEDVSNEEILKDQSPFVAVRHTGDFFHEFYHDKIHDCVGEELDDEEV
ncbi:hypothetical protein Porky_119 [Mycobacterium phage Porky]|uniref:Uncharacterized protein n=1 Tax=Mycobacterium phage Porky TaxID=2914015 RepID=B5A679_9CAUD|nr:hypothetical protein Porky_119 [Mycobacterium phage Porky]YP_008051743.1 hypothetical protein PBI_DUMBO_120 [Mycobacterium phage Dumbo]ASZ73604.1 hypothetical protein SEA_MADAMMONKFISH_119 [Mycobacterium phage MadamMonkfish]QGJ94436.1 hypothetical protein SEA_CHOSENONE_120 [Mycobacterium phage ChosenOne]QGJ95188.1 hypothetical protein SEA_ELITE2014_119 [Mycobacterium phage Elite2014]QGJ96132.1 hypothetical protein SEA_LILPICKLE_119 [Mycobacterium phage Lilpickle]WRQ08862.1 hypothetical pro